jgi:DNA-directed RNA polymerase subunit beta'
MALELFKPFVMKRLVQKGYTSNIKTARRMIDRLKPEVWDALEEVITDHPVMLNRAPTLHRLGIQAFEPTLVDGKAIQLHPLVCPSFNADFDGDQMAVHVPLFAAAQAEARLLMMSTNNLFSPRDGAPAMTPSYDMVLGCYYLTMQKRGDKEIKDLTDEEIQALPHFTSGDEAILAVERRSIHVQDTVVVRHAEGDKIPRADGSTPDMGRMVTTPGRLVFNEIVPEVLGFQNKAIDKKTIAQLIERCHAEIGNEATVKLLDDVKDLGFSFGTRSGVSISINDVDVQSKRKEILEKTEESVRRTNRAYEDDPYSMTPQERERRVLNAWIKASQDVSNDVMRSMNKFNPFYMMAQSGARGSTRQITQIVGMRGLMMDPSGRFIEDLPVRSNFREGLALHEYFVSTHGARKGLADTALRTADAGYLTRRLVDVSQDVIVRTIDCGTDDGIVLRDIVEGDEVLSPSNRTLLGRRLAEAIKHPDTGEILHEEETPITAEILQQLAEVLPESARVRVHKPEVTLGERIVGRVVTDAVKDPASPRKTLVKANELITREMAEKIETAGVREVKVRSVLTCKQGRGICAKCYGMDLAANGMVEIGEAVGIIAAQSIGEPGTQLTMRTFHLGGVASGTSLTGVANVKKARQQALQELRSDIDKGNLEMRGTATEQKREIQRYLKVLEATVGGLLRVVELFEARKPKGEAITSDIDGTVVAIVGGQRAEIQEGVTLSGVDIASARTGVRKVFVHTDINIGERDRIIGETLADAAMSGKKELLAAGQEVTERALDQLEKGGVSQVTIRREFAVPYRGNLDVRVGQIIEAGDTLTKGPLWPQDVLAWRGLKGVADYLVQEVQKVYRTQGILIHDKHIEVIVRQMLRKRRVKDPGDTDLMPGKLVDNTRVTEKNELANAEGYKPATADFVLLGITEAALNTESFLSAASFQKTTKVLTEAATHGSEDKLEGLKENVIIGRLIPAGTGLGRRAKVEVELDKKALDFAIANAEILGAAELAPARPEREKLANIDEMFVVETGGADESEMAEAGMSVNEGGDADLSDDDSDPTLEDLEDVEVSEDDLGEIDSFESSEE